MTLLRQVGIKIILAYYQHKYIFVEHNYYLTVNKYMFAMVLVHYIRVFVVLEEDNKQLVHIVQLPKQNQIQEMIKEPILLFDFHTYVLESQLIVDGIQHSS